MECQPAREWLMQSERPSLIQAAPGEVADHLRSCAACQKLTRDLEELERRWREAPLPASAARGRDALLERIATPSLLPVRNPSPRFAARRWAVAAAVLLAVGLAALLFVGPPQALAKPDVVERLLDWNLELTETDTLAERSRIYAHQAASLQSDVRRAVLTPEDRDLAESLLKTGGWLAENDDPMDEAEQFTSVADVLLERMHRTAEKKPREAERLARLYRRVTESGIEAKMERVRKVNDAKQQRRLEKLQAREAERQVRLSALLERVPAPSHKQIRQALDSTRKHSKPRGRK